MIRRLQYTLAGSVVGPLLLKAQGFAERRRRRGRRSPGGPFGPPLESTRKLKDLMSLHYLQGRYADGAVPVAWVTSGFPVEILRPLGFHTVYPENHAAMCGVQRIVPELSEAIEREGYARDLCSYVRTDLGSLITGQTPAGRLPRPDLLACCTNICQTVLYWYKDLAHRLGVPLVVIDTPFVYGEARPHHVQYVREQLEELVVVAERVSRRKLDPAELVAVTRLAKEASELWGECLATAAARPAPWTGFDGFFHMAPVVALRGTEACCAYYRHLLDELRHRVRLGISGIRDERHRLLWDNLPMWFGVRDLSRQLAERGFNFVCTSYTNAWAEAGRTIDPLDPLGSAARTYMHIILNQDLANRLEILTRLSRTYACDGAVLHSDRSCKPYSIGQVDLRDRLAADLGMRVLLLESDHNDPRAWSAAQGRDRLEAFMEGFE
jgi:benzoyl-CoA reductase/2-hydroxyglutaryl-CoA dehydratase subunit BcrC/BadD/HgdB